MNTSPIQNSTRGAHLLLEPWVFDLGNAVTEIMLTGWHPSWFASEIWAEIRGSKPTIQEVREYLEHLEEVGQATSRRYEAQTHGDYIPVEYRHVLRLD